MVPKVAARGSSFKGAGAYYLHDKKAASSERVAFTYTENLPVNDPARAIDCMAYTAMHQNDIKAAAGAARTGRKLTQPVYTYSLSWAPDEEPTKEEMIEAARESLKALGLDEHETLMVAHNDEPHPHIHVIVNRVHPETGKAAVLSNDHLVLSRWAEAYEKRQGQIRCEQRVENNEARRKGQFVRDRRNLQGAFHRWRRDRLRRAYAARRAAADNLGAQHLGERQALFDQKETRLRRLRADRKQHDRPQWAELFRRQREEWKALNQAQQSAYGRLRHFLQGRAAGEGPATKANARQIVKEAIRAVVGRDNPHGALARRHQAERKALAAKLQDMRRPEVRAIEQDYQRALAKLKQAQLQERRTLQQAHSRESQALAREIREGRDRQQYRREAGQAVGDEFARRVRQQMEEAKKRRAQDRDKGRDDGGRER
ncbi:relaxase/mobilization nuclease domain-containing protein [Nitratireductor sp.]|uniref:relaxase/mobilization nuclease domain-containing protein n=1 Tax=Nitratireductor sp. TaxID=1872084 RepID=UPI00263A0440|nr:relaxase/mobilization nuclease domain-containing protein [Nitratireductor sp.]MCV0381726.1 relaxase/mobilization nuclease domain-containing protein [Nitratireductor sp.]